MCKTSWLVRISLLITALNKRVLLFSWESYFIKAIENFFPVFADPDINTRGVGRILDSYAPINVNPMGGGVRARGGDLTNFKIF